jgi:hypothetical protein
MSVSLLAILLVLPVLSSSGAQEEAGQSLGVELRKAARSRVIPAGLVVRYDDMHGLHGGTTIEIGGDGRGVWRSRRAREARPREGSFLITEGRLRQMVELLVELEIWEQREAERQAAPDESRASVTVEVAGASAECWEWYNDLSDNRRLGRVKELLESLAAIQ